jgi:hypothetical protein
LPSTRSFGARFVSSKSSFVSCMRNKGLTQTLTPKTWIV